MVNFTAVRSGRNLLFDEKDLPPDFDPNKAWGLGKEESEVWKLYQEKEAEKKRRIQEKMQEARAEREAGISKEPTTGAKAGKLATSYGGEVIKVYYPDQKAFATGQTHVHELETYLKEINSGITIEHVNSAYKADYIAYRGYTYKTGKLKGQAVPPEKLLGNPFGHQNIETGNQIVNTKDLPDTLDKYNKWLRGESIPGITAEQKKKLDIVRTGLDNKLNMPVAKVATGAVGDAVEIMHPHPASVLHETPFRFMERIHRYDEALVLANPEKLYIFGDNLERWGKKKQSVIRDADNAIGIATKESPYVFMDDANFEANKVAIDTDIEKVIQEAKKYDGVVFPSDGIGTGEAALKTKAPKTAQYLEERLLYLESQVGIEFRSVEHAYQSLKGNGLDEVAYQKYIDDTRDFSKQPVKITGKKRFAGGKFSENLWVDAGVQAAYENPQRAQEILAISPDTKITHGAKDKYWRENFEPLFRKVQSRVGNISKAPVAAGKTAQATEFFRVPDNATPHSNHYGNRTWYNSGIEGDVTIDFSSKQEGSGATKRGTTNKQLIAEHGEKLYHRVDLSDTLDGKFYNAPQLKDFGIAPVHKEAVDIVAEHLVSGKTVNIAGDGIYSFSHYGTTQVDINNHMKSFFSDVMEQIGDRPITGKVISGGQSGFDIAGIKAAHGLGIDTKINYSAEKAGDVITHRPPKGDDITESISDYRKRMFTPDTPVLPGVPPAGHDILSAGHIRPGMGPEETMIIGTGELEKNAENIIDNALGVKGLGKKLLIKLSPLAGVLAWAYDPILTGTLFGVEKLGPKLAGPKLASKISSGMATRTVLWLFKKNLWLALASGVQGAYKGAPQDFHRAVRLNDTDALYDAVGDMTKEEWLHIGIQALDGMFNQVIGSPDALFPMTTDPTEWLNKGISKGVGYEWRADELPSKAWNAVNKGTTIDTEPELVEAGK